MSMCLHCFSEALVAILQRLNQLKIKFKTNMFVNSAVYKMCTYAFHLLWPCTEAAVLELHCVIVLQSNGSLFVFLYWIILCEFAKMLKMGFWLMSETEDYHSPTTVSFSTEQKNYTNI